MSSTINIEAYFICLIHEELATSAFLIQYNIVRYLPFVKLKQKLTNLLLIDSHEKNMGII